MHLRIEQFVREYLVDLNAAAAARRCGYPASSAKTRGNKLMARQDVQEAVKRAMAERAERTGVTADRVVLEYARIAFADARKYYDWGPWGVKLRPASALDADAAAAVAIVKDGGGGRRRWFRLRLHDKHRALDMLARHVGLTAERRRTYSLRPDDTLADRAGYARAGRAAREILRDGIAAEDDEFSQLAQEIAAAWRTMFGGAAAKR
ncbi:MAG TPA: terminase small subunit [Stellaceae bacterium]|nr:terminase small subunit [Stellaceae bacterium]